MLSLPRRCPVCGGTFLRFRPGGAVQRPRARCPRCGALERHRLLAVYLERSTDLLARRQRVLHWAPEAPLAARLRAVHGEDYEGADLDPDDPAVVPLDMQSVDRPDAAYDCILCLHVLEHVPDDHAALREMRRLLRPGGSVVLQVPMRGPVTDEDPELGPRERLARFGQEDHVRLYGTDFLDRVAAAGFRVRVDHPIRCLSAAERRRLGVVPRGFSDRLDLLGFVVAER